MVEVLIAETANQNNYTMQVLNDVLRQKLKEEKMLNLTITQKYKEAIESMDKLVDEVVRLDKINCEAKMHTNVLWEKFQVEKMASQERRNLLIQLRRDHEDELTMLRNSMTAIPKRMSTVKSLAALQCKETTSEKEDFEEFIEGSEEIIVTGHELPTQAFSQSSDNFEPHQISLPRRGSWEQYQEDAFERAREELFSQPPVELPPDVLANLLVDPQLQGGECLRRSLSWKNSPQLRNAPAGCVDCQTINMDLSDTNGECVIKSEEVVLGYSNSAVETGSDDAASLSEIPSENIPIVESDVSEKSVHESSNKGDEQKSSLESNALIGLDGKDHVLKTYGVIPLSLVIEENVTRIDLEEEELDVEHISDNDGLIVFHSSQLAVQQKDSNSVSMVTPLLKMDSSSILKLLRNGCIMQVNTSQGEAFILEEELSVFSDGLSSVATEGVNMQEDALDWARSPVTDMMSLLISHPITDCIMPTVKRLDLQHVFSLSVKVKPKAIPKTSRGRQKSERAYNSHNKLKVRSKSNKAESREIRYKTSLRETQAYRRKYHSSSPQYTKGSPPSNFQRKFRTKPKTVLIQESNMPFGPLCVRSKFNTNHNKQRGLILISSPKFANSKSSSPESWQRASDQELKLSSENFSSDSQRQRREVEVGFRSVVKNHKAKSSKNDELKERSKSKGRSQKGRCRQTGFLSKLSKISFVV